MRSDDGPLKFPIADIIVMVNDIEVGDSAQSKFVGGIDPGVLARWFVYCDHWNIETFMK